MKRISYITLLLLTLSSNAQVAYDVVGDSMNLRVNSNGMLGVDLNTLQPRSNVAGTDLHFISQAGLWIAAEDTQGNIHTSIQHLRATDSFDFWPGPVDTLTGQTGDIAAWDKVWGVTSEDIEFHKDHYSDADYVVPSSIENWPVPGTNGFNRYLAPFVDVDGDKEYDPTKGDYPYIKGSQAYYTIFNDIADEHTASLGIELGLEVHLMAYQLSGSSSIFLEYFVVARRPSTYKNVRVAFFLGGACGNPNDNFAGTKLSEPHTLFIYNGDDNDEGNFGTDLPYVAATFLNRHIDASMVFYETGVTGSPKLTSEYSNLLNNKWLDGSPLTLGNNGYGGITPTSFAFPHEGSANWSEEDDTNTPGRRNLLGIAHLGAMSKGDFVKLEICLFAGTSTSDKIKSTIFARAFDELEKFRAIASVPDSDQESDITVYPNPSNGQFTIKGMRPGSTILITNNQGVKLKEIKNTREFEQQCNISAPPGVYILEVRSDLRTYRRMLVISN